MKICRYIGFSFVLAMFLLTSCFDDKGNYDYKEIGEAVIKAIPGVTDNGDKLVCLENEHIQLTPELEFKEGTTAEDYEFIWYRYPQQPQGTYQHYEQGDTLAMTRNLDYRIVDSPRDYWLVYKVINKKTGAQNEQRFEFIISAVNGWIVLDEDAAGNGDLQIIRDKDIVEGGNGQVVKDYFSVNNGGKKMQGARFIGICTNSSVSNLYVYSDEGAYIMDASTYKEREDATYAGLFNSVVTLDAVNPQAHVYETDHRRMDVLVNNHKVYAIAYIMMGESQYSEAKGVDDYVAAPAIAPVRISGHDNCAVLFDTKNNRFITISGSKALAAPVSAGGAFNTAAIDPDLEYVYMNEGKDSETCLVMKHKTTGDFYLFRANLAATEPVAVACENLGNLTDMSEAKQFVFGIRGNVLFYATDTKVYAWRNGKEEATECMTVGAGERISQIKISNNPSENVMTGKVLFVATQKGDEGKVYKAVFNEMSGLLLEEPLEYTGFKLIRDMFYK